MKAELNEIEINGEVYVKKGLEKRLAEKIDGMKYVIVRTYSAGVHAGYLKSRQGKDVSLVNSRRVWYWDGACSISQLAVDGSKKPENCKISCVVPEITLTEAIEIIPCTESSVKFFKEAAIWQR